MVNNTETYWEADGHSLHTYAWSIETIGNMGPPPLRGSNIVIPGHPGAQHVEKTPDQNVLSLGMWLRGVDEDADMGVSAATRRQYMSRYNDLVRLLWRDGDPFPLRKRFYDQDSSVIVSATAQAEYSGGMKPVLTGRTLGKCIIDLTIPGAFFYDDNTTTETLLNGDNIINMPGNAKSLNTKIRINGSRDNTRIWNKTNDTQFIYPNAILNTEYVDIDVINYTATHKPAGGPEYDASSRVIHSGAFQWLILKPGENVINVSSDSGIGIVSFEAKGAWV